MKLYKLKLRILFIWNRLGVEYTWAFFYSSGKVVVSESLNIIHAGLRNVDAQPLALKS